MNKKKTQVLDSAPGYDLASGGYDKKEAYLNSFEKGQVFELLGDVMGKKILDVGAGTGRLAIPLQKKGGVVTACDVSAEMLKVLARKNRHIEIVVGEAESLPFPDNYFDIVTAAFLIVHLKNPTRFFDEVYRVLKDGGLFLVTNVNQKDPPVVETKVGPIVIESFYHRPEEVREILEELAFLIESETLVKENTIWINQIVLAKK
ncbi:MAG: methyltransferase domain-containing protein [Candidatus Magasanikbacteria bacterium]|nr:methyltransferase domain-containing protein [Candidatus Magasanikbacteria bacterium]